VYGKLNSASARRGLEQLVLLGIPVPSHEPFIDADGIKKQKHLTQEEFESLV
jgi:hypothetical protein